MTVVRSIPELFISTPNNTPTNVVSADVANNTITAGFLDYLIEATDGTNGQAESGQVFFQAINSGGSVQASVRQFDREELVITGTLQSTWTITAANPAVLQVTVASSLTNSGSFPRMTVNVHNLGRQNLNV